LYTKTFQLHQLKPSYEKVHLHVHDTSALLKKDNQHITIIVTPFPLTGSFNIVQCIAYEASSCLTNNLQKQKENNNEVKPSVTFKKSQ